MPQVAPKGDRYYTDGEIKIVRLVAGCDSKSQTAVLLDNPPLVQLKNEAWQPIAAILKLADDAPPAK